MKVVVALVRASAFLAATMVGWTGKVFGSDQLVRIGLTLARRIDSTAFDGARDRAVELLVADGVDPEVARREASKVTNGSDPRRA